MKKFIAVLALVTATSAHAQSPLVSPSLCYTLAHWAETVAQGRIDGLSEVATGSELVATVPQLPLRNLMLDVTHRIYQYKQTPKVASNIMLSSCLGD